MLARARREAEEMRAAEERAQLVEEARRLIIEAEAARANAETLLQRQRQQAAAESARQASPSNAEATQRATADAEARRARRRRPSARAQGRRKRRGSPKFAARRRGASSRASIACARSAMRALPPRSAAPSPSGRSRRLNRLPRWGRAEPRPGDETEHADRGETRSVGSSYHSGGDPRCRQPSPGWRSEEATGRMIDPRRPTRTTDRLIGTPSCSSWHPATTAFAGAVRRSPTRSCARRTAASSATGPTGRPDSCGAARRWASSTRLASARARAAGNSAACSAAWSSAASRTICSPSTCTS